MSKTISIALVDFDTDIDKINVCKRIRVLAGIGLKEARDLQRSLTASELRNFRRFVPMGSELSGLVAAHGIG